MDSLQNICLRISFCGSAYSGFQVQRDRPSISAAVSNSIKKVYGKRFDIKGCSRTDAGVHANEYFLSFITDIIIPKERAANALAFCLPSDMALLDMRQMPMDFHARYCAKEKEYIYKIHRGENRDPFMASLALHFPKELNFPSMDIAMKKIIGTHDFVGFSSVRDAPENTVRTISEFKYDISGDMLCFSIKADGFLFHMVRCIIGTVLAVGQGKMGPSVVDDVFATGDRRLAGITLPAHGLYLNRVFYS